jgi:FkbM family methyltransferase
MINWRFIAAKKILRSKWERGFMWDFDSFIDYSEDFNREVILRYGSTFIDAGAHVGMWTVPASKYYTRIIAIEPTPKIAKRLKKNLALNKIENVTVIQKALSDHDGFARFYRWPDGAMGNALQKEPVNYTSDYGQGIEDGTIETITIDSLGAMPSCIKLDIEGEELKAIRGGLKTIQFHHPTLVIEIHRTENESAIRKLLPEYEWNRRIRHMEIAGKEQFDQVHLLGTYR